MSPDSALRGVSAIRLSVLTDETTSPERQRDANYRVAASMNIRFDGREAEDLDVSASKTSPFDRQQLGAWLRRPDEFDVLVWWRFDRAVRSMADMHDLAKWAREHRKMLVFAEGIGGSGQLVFDFRKPFDPVAELMMMLFAFAAQVEAMSIRERVLGAQAAMRAMQFRWRGSRPPYGYMPESLDGGGWTLIPDPDAVAVIERIIRDLLDGKTVSAIASTLNHEGIPSPRDYWALKKGRSTGGKTGGAKGEGGVTRERFAWSPGALSRLLTSYSLIGWKTHAGNPVRDAEGRPVMATAEPILTRAEFDRVGALLKTRAINNRERRDTDCLLLRVIHCAVCEGRMYYSRPTGASVTAHYKCNAHARGDKCSAPSNIRADWADEYVEREFLALMGGLRVVTVLEIPGYDPAPEIAATLAEYEAHQEQEGRLRSSAARQAWQKRADALDARLAELEATPRVESRRETVDTGRTYAELWEASDTTGRRKLLVEAGARLMVHRGRSGGWRRLDESRVRFDIAHYDDAERVEMEEALHQATL